MAFGGAGGKRNESAESVRDVGRRRRVRGGPPARRRRRRHSRRRARYWRLRRKRFLRKRRLSKRTPASLRGGQPGGRAAVPARRAPRVGAGFQTRGAVRSRSEGHLRRARVRGRERVRRGRRRRRAGHRAWCERPRVRRPRTSGSEKTRRLEVARPGRLRRGRRAVPAPRFGAGFGEERALRQRLRLRQDAGARDGRRARTRRGAHRARRLPLRPRVELKSWTAGYRDRRC